MPRLLPWRVIASKFHRTVVATLGIALLAGACAAPPKPPAPAAVPAPAAAAAATVTTPPSASPSPSQTPFPKAPSPKAASPKVVTSGCPPTLAGQLVTTGVAAELVTVVAPAAGSTSATVNLWQRTAGCWSLASGPWPARVGATGVSDHHREGDGSTPSGMYGIGPVMYGIAASPGVRYAYHRLVCGDWWDEDPASPTYNTFQHVACGAAPPFKGKSEALWQATSAYQMFAVVDYNAHPPVPGAGSAVFIHDDTGGPTIGCVSVAATNLVRLLQWLDPAQSPLIVIGTEAAIRRL